MIPYADLQEYNSGVNITKGVAHKEIYMKNCCVACLSAQEKNQGISDVALVTNIAVVEPYRSLLLQQGIKIYQIPFDKFDFGGDYTWSLAFYKLCALYHICRESHYIYYAYLDSDVYFQSDFSAIWAECDHHIMLYDINHGYQVEHYRHFLKEVDEFLSSSTYITHFGGEFFAAEQQHAILFSQKCLDVYEEMRKRNFVTTHGDEFILSIVASQMKSIIKNAGAYICRYWTAGFRLVSTNYCYNPVVVLHVPSEKQSGMLNIYHYFLKHGKMPPAQQVWRKLHLNKISLTVRIKIIAKKILGKIYSR